MLCRTIEREGEQEAIIGRPGQAEFGAYFIGYSRDLWVIEPMLRNMFIGDLVVNTG